jgi:hypothetical protein
MSAPARKPPYIIPCSTDFRDEILALAIRKKVNVADIARSVLLSAPSDVIRDFKDPGGPAQEDREQVKIASGSAEGRVLKRKPRLQMRLPAGYDRSVVRRALALALAVDQGEVDMSPPVEPDNSADAEIEGLNKEIDRLKSTISMLSFELLPEGPQTRGQALYVLGFPPGARPSKIEIRSKYMMLAAIHHPDSDYGDHKRMSQLNMAKDLLRP